jgi:nucleotide-binding universal stress UspA family protein
MMKILIGHDGSQSADAALVDLRRAGLPVEAEALVVSVADVMMVSATPAYEFAGEALMSRRVTAGLVHAQRQTERVLNEAKDFARRASDQVRSHFPHWSVRGETLAGPAASELISKADEWNPDLIVVGSHGHWVGCGNRNDHLCADNWADYSIYCGQDGRRSGTPDGSVMSCK